MKKNRFEHCQRCGDEETFKDNDTGKTLCCGMAADMLNELHEENQRLSDRAAWLEQLCTLMRDEGNLAYGGDKGLLAFQRIKEALAERKNDK